MNLRHRGRGKNTQKKRADDCASAPNEMRRKCEKKVAKHYSSATMAQITPITALPVAIHSGGVM